MSHGTIASSYLDTSLADLPWISGASGTGVGDGTFATWRGSNLKIASVDASSSIGNQAGAWVLDPGQAFDQWTKDIDWAFGAIYKDDGQTWANAAAGAYDSQWTTALTNIRNKWNNKARGQFYLRFAHDMNGDWTDWTVEVGEVDNFKAAWIRFYNIKQSVWPAIKLVFAPHGNTVGPDHDWRTLWPGDAYVDVCGVFWHSHQWDIQGSLPVDNDGGPISLALHQQFAIDRGKPFAITNWCMNRGWSSSDTPAYIDYMYNFFSTNYGTGPGQLLYETYLNESWAPQCLIFPEGSTQSPLSAARYRQIF